MTMSYTIFNKCKIDKSRVPKCYAMTTNIRLKNPTCRTYIFKRLLSYVFNQINNSIMVLIETVGQKNKNPRLRDLAAKNSRIRDAKKHKKTRFRDSFKTPPRFRDWNKNSETLNKTNHKSCARLSVLHTCCMYLQQAIERQTEGYTGRHTHMQKIALL